MSCCPGIQSKIYKGYAKTAQILGQSFNHYRAQSSCGPIVPGNLLGSIKASFTVNGGYTKPNGYAKPTWQVYVDGNVINVGDYLVGEATYFIAAKQPILPILAVECNRMVTVGRREDNEGVGPLEYGGLTEDNLEPFMKSWPASVLQGTKGEKNEVSLPGDVRSPWWAILLPAYPGAIIESSDVITDDLGRRYIVSSAELTDLGWRLTAQQAET